MVANCSAATAAKVGGHLDSSNYHCTLNLLYIIIGALTHTVFNLPTDYSLNIPPTAKVDTYLYNTVHCHSADRFASETENAMLA